ncbi:hypothetical protein PUNSTDRAFT_66798 [Punctularia strigosozonata HHB-11173 SS5]|uniref:uncharacterized protein n=1 Tax=Punctularia strigosozonata (strain HHB-11173) TaxID=741275 RepID=UPI00044185B3|nr:uncharacterized protein PUNSTDRAFT_66798 [Punctularia strigosozonata HHB-11173 SS5]EIN09456.1 hypothetical protein PUNSTDRAFT_66798 [Punctularia strigosozonata HHB-11173 SS5]
MGLWLEKPPSLKRVVADPASSATQRVAILSTPGQPSESSNRPTEKRSRTSMVRTAKKGCEVRSSPYRPHVVASTRLTSWTSAWAAARRQELAGIFGEDIADARLRIALAALDEKTRSVYAAGILRYSQFCDKHNISESQRIPAHPIVIVAFVKESLGKVSGSCVRNWLSGLRCWHHIMGAPWPEDDPLLSMSRVAARKEGRLLTRGPRPPVSAKHMACLRGTLTPTDPLDVAIWAVASNAFWGCRRLGELLPSTAEDMKHHHHPKRDTIVADIQLQAAAPGAGVSYHIPWTKTSQEKGASVILIGLNNALCPVKALVTHQMINAGANIDDHFFAYRSGPDSFSPLTKPRFMARCNEIWSNAGLETLSGHCFRIGGTTHWLLMGTAPEIVAAIGGWTSMAFLLYWRKIEEIVAAGALKSVDRHALEQAASAVNMFRETQGLTDLDVEKAM